MPDFVLYRAFYCGICKSTGRLFGQLPRFATNYDITFLGVLLHGVQKIEPQLQSSGCIMNPIRKKLTVCSNPLLDKIVCTNIILTYHKLEDAVLDREGLSKRSARRLFLKAYKKAAVMCPEIDKVVKSSYKALFEAERQKTQGIDRVSEHFSRLLMDVADILLEGKASESVKRLCYNVGKFVYLIDALDDVDEDFKKKRYNPFLAVYPKFSSRKEYYLEYKDEIEFALNSTVNRAIEFSNQIFFDLNANLVYNIIHKGLRAKVVELLKSDKKLKKPKL